MKRLLLLLPLLVLSGCSKCYYIYYTCVGTPFVLNYCRDSEGNTTEPEELGRSDKLIQGYTGAKMRVYFCE